MQITYFLMASKNIDFDPCVMGTGNFPVRASDCDV